VRDALDAGEVETFQLAVADDDVGDLHAGVVDVVLHLHGRAAELQHAHERVAQRGVAQVADVCRLVGIDRRVLDDRLAFRLPRAAGGRCGGGANPQALEQERGTVDEYVEIPARRGLDARDAVTGGETGRDLLGNGARRLAQPPRELEGDRRTDVAQRAIRRCFERDVQRSRVDVPQLGDDGADPRPDSIVQRKNHDGEGAGG